MVRKRISFAGRVQGVGFRWRAEKAADMFRCTGWCRNEWDGTVSMEIQGREEDIDQVILHIEGGRYVRIENMRIKEIPIVDSFDIFNKRAPIVCTCEIPDDQKRLDPKQKLQYTLMEQDADSLIWHCKKDHFDSCIVHFNRVDGKIIKAELDVSAIVLQIELSASIMTDAYDRNPGSENETL